MNQRIDSIESLSQIIATALETDQVVRTDTHASEIEKWDSLGHIMILAQLDDLVSGLLDSNPELSAATSVIEIWEIIAKHRGDR